MRRDGMDVSHIMGPGFKLRSKRERETKKIR